jgi:hypothetical protein
MQKLKRKCLPQSLSMALDAPQFIAGWLGWGLRGIVYRYEENKSF